MNINIDGINTNYIDVGTGKIVLLLHGWGSNIMLFNSMISALQGNYRVVALDMPGFGSTDEPPAPMDVDDYTDFVTKFIKLLKLDDFHILGHSFGGRVIIKMLNRKNDFKIDKVLLVDAAGIKPKKSFKVQMKVKSFKLARKLFEGTILGKMYPNFIENMRKKSGSADYNQASPVMRSSLVKVVNEDLTPMIGSITNETMIIWGDKDDATPISDAHLMYKLIGNSYIVIVEGAGHYSFLEQAVFVNKVILDFLNGDYVKEK